MAKAPPCPERTLKTPFAAAKLAREEEGHWVWMEDRRRRGIAFEKEMLRYLDDMNEYGQTKTS